MKCKIDTDILKVLIFRRIFHAEVQRIFKRFKRRTDIIRHAYIPENNFRQILRLFCTDLTAVQISELMKTERRTAGFYNYCTKGYRS